jgi:arylsulfatase A-like enzyme
LFIAVDDLRPELGCYGAQGALTPNIDALASRSLVFNRAYCQYPLCSPSRTSVLTGRRPETTRIFDLKTSFRETHPDWVTLPQLFKNNGYTALSIGKIFHGVQGLMSDPASWSAMPSWGKDVAPDPGGLRQKGHGLPYEALDTADENLPDGDVANQVIQALRDNADKPFFLAMGMAKPHLPFVAPKKYWDAERRTSVTLPENSDLPKDAPAFASNLSGELRQYVGMPRQGQIPVDEQIELKTGYLASTAYMDAQVGKVIAELDRLKLSEKTVIVLWGDHGYCLGEHGTWTKHNLWEETARVPLIMYVPSGAGAGRESDALVELVDLYPTLADLCEIPAPAGLEGDSFRPILMNPAAKGKDAAFTSWRKTAPGIGKLEGKSMRTDRYRLTVWQPLKDTSAEPVVELYDHQADPSETVNIAARAENKELVWKLTKQLEACWQTARAGNSLAAKDAARIAPVASGDETITSFTLNGGVRVALQQPGKNDPAVPDHLVFYLLPNGSTIEHGMGRTPEQGLDFRYASQQVAAQTRRVRQLLPDRDITTAYLEANTRSWPAWRREQADPNTPIQEIVEAVRQRVAPGGEATSAAAGQNAENLGTTLTIDLVAHSGGGSFIWGYLNSVETIPDYVEHIVFLDANYSYEDTDRHGEKLLAWLQRAPSHRLIVLAYDDRRITLNGKPVVSDTGGTWRATDRMARYFEKHMALTSGQMNDLQTSAGLGGRLLMARHPNPDNKILHSVMVERNGFVFGVTEGRGRATPPLDLPFAGSAAGEETYRYMLLP